MPTEKEYSCAYGKYCLHPGLKVKASESVDVGKKHYHWDCIATKQEIDEIRKTYFEKIDDKASFPVLSKVLNDLIFKYNMDIDFVRFAVNYYGDYKMKIKSPFTLLYLRDNKAMERKWKNSKVG